MGLGETIQGRGPAAWPGGPGLCNTGPGPDNPARARTPQEALAYIGALYKTGRMGELARLLRRSRVFREAWLLVQRSSGAALETSKAVQDASPQGKAGGSGTVAAAGAGSQGTGRMEPAGAVVAVQGFTGAIPVRRIDLRASGQAGQTGQFPAVLLQIYQSRDLYFLQEKGARPQFSVKV